MKWIGTQTIYDQVRFKKNVDFSEDVTFYQPVNDANPTISLGSSATDRFEIKSIYNSGAQTLLSVDLKSYSSSSTANDGKIRFFVDEVQTANFNDDGFFLNASKSLTIGSGNAIISDSSGTTTLSNIDAIDATTEATIESAIDTLGNLTSASSLVTVGTIGTGVWNGTAIASAYIADDAVTFAKASGVSPNVFGSTIKLLPSDFAANIDGGNTKFGVGYTNTAGAAYGMKVGSANTELFAFVSIPEGMDATHVDVYDKDDRVLEVFEVQIDANTMTSKGSGNCNTTLDITDVTSTATNFLAIKITTTQTTDKVFGGKVTIAAS